MKVITAMNEDQKKSKDTLVDGLGSTASGRGVASTGCGAANLHVNAAEQAQSPVTEKPGG